MPSRKKRSRRRQGRNPSRETSEGQPVGFSWFPGHMHKAQERLKEELRSVDVVLEVRDARVPRLSGNTELEAIIGQRRRIILLNKAALADSTASRAWSQWFADQALPHLFLDADKGKAVNMVFPLLREALADRDATLRQRGMRPPLYKLLVVGMPNVGKSTLINRLAGQNKLRTAPEPGITRSVTWLNLRDRYLLADSPGIMLPRLPDEATANMLGWIGTIRDAVAGEERLATSLIAYLAARNHVAPLRNAYGIATGTEALPAAWLDDIAQARGLLAQGGQADRYRACRLVLDDFRAGNLGRITLELPPTQSQRAPGAEEDTGVRDEP